MERNSNLGNYQGEKSDREKSNAIDEVSSGAIVEMRDRLLKMQREGKKVYRLESGDPSFNIPDHVAEAIINAIKSNKTHYTDSSGIPELREAIAEKLKKKNGIKHADSDHVVVTNGGMNGLNVLFRALLSEGDRVVIPDPMWTEIGENIKLAGGVPLPVNVDKYIEGFEKALKNDHRIRAVFLNSPHNPTGKVLTGDEIRSIVDLASENDLTVVSDEAYEDVIFDGRSNVSPASIYENTISVYSMSKTYAMSGLRLGYVYSKDSKMVSRFKKLLRCTINGVNSITQYGAVAALKGPQGYIEDMKNEYQKRRDIIYSAVSGSKYLDPVKPGGAFYLWCHIKEYPEDVNDSAGMSEYILEKTGVGSSPGIAFGNAGKNYVRFAFSADTQQITEASNILHEKI
ncbi:MAG: pyridoxal phosphate-dependent aminotransferase [Thermoplasmata archaeon]